MKEAFSALLKDKRRTAATAAVALVGIVLLLIGAAPHEEKVQATQTDPAAEIEVRLEKILSKIDGAGKVSVMVTMEDRGEAEFARNSGEIAMAKGRSGGEDALVVRNTEPKIRGVVAVCDGGGDANVRADIIAALAALTGADAAQIRVFKRRGQ